MESRPASSTEVAACERCGNFDALEIAGRMLCAECVTLAGSSCGGSPVDEDC